jgi:hypothetical protein
MTDPNEIARLLIREYFPEFSSCCLTIKFKHVDGSISEVRHTYAFKDNQYKGVIKIYLDDSIRTSGLKALIGTIAQEMTQNCLHIMVPVIW